MISIGFWRLRGRNNNLPFRWDHARLPRVTLIAELNEYLTVNGVRRDYGTFCGPNCLYDLHSNERFPHFRDFARLLLARYFNITTSPFQYTLGRAGDFVIRLWENLQDVCYGISELIY